MNTIKTTIIATAAVALAGCHSADNYADNSLAFNRVEMQQSYRLAGSAADYDSDCDISFGCNAELLMPTVLFGKPVEALQDSILNTAFGTYGPDHAKVIASAMRKAAEESGYKVVDTVLPDSVVRDVPNFLSRYDGFSAVEGDVETLTSKVLSYAVTNSTYFPSAAHGMYGTRYINYDLDKGKVIGLTDIFTTEGIAALPGIIRSTAVKMESTIGMTDITTLPADDNFYLTAGAEIVFAYQPYEVASYAQGEIQIPIAAYLLSQYLTDEGTALLLNR